MMDWRLDLPPRLTFVATQLELLLIPLLLLELEPLLLTPLPTLELLDLRLLIPLLTLELLDLRLLIPLLTLELLDLRLLIPLPTLELDLLMLLLVTLLRLQLTAHLRLPKVLDPLGLRQLVMHPFQDPWQRAMAQAWRLPQQLGLNWSIGLIH
jgi:hypothetical protein